MQGLPGYLQILLWGGVDRVGKQRKAPMCTWKTTDTMTGLGLRATLPALLCPNKLTRNSMGTDQNPRNQNEHPQKASKVQQRKQLKVSSKSKEQQSLSPPMDVNMVESRKPGEEMTWSYQLAPKQLCPLRKASTFGQWIKKSAGPWKGKNNIWAHRPRGKQNPVVYEEIDDPKEND